jgi:predicted dehydrogenase
MAMVNLLRNEGGQMTIAVGLVGAGTRAAQVHAPALANSPEFTFAGVWSRSPRAVHELAERHGVPACDKFLELLDHCDAVAFAVPPPVQAELAAVAAQRGKAILLERPMAGDVAGAEELAEAVQMHKVVSQLDLSWRYASDVRRFLGPELKRIKPISGMGRVISARHLPGHAIASWRVERGVLRDQGVDLLDLLEAALGPIVGVRAHGERAGWVGLMLDHQVGHYSEASLSATAEIDKPVAEIEVFGAGGQGGLDCTQVVGPDTYRTMYAEFAEAIRSGSAPRLNAEHGLHLQRVIEAAETDLLLGT